MRPVRSSALALALTAGLALPGEVAAQDLRYTETTTVEMGGPMGAMMRMMGGVEGLDEPTVETVWIKGTLMRRDRAATSTIIDWSTGEVLELDREARTYTRTTWDRMTRAMMDDAAAQQRNVMTGPDAPELEVSFRTEETGRTERIAGYEATQVLAIIDMDATVTQDAEARPGMMGLSLGTAMVTELWMSTEFPAWELLAAAQRAVTGAWSGADLNEMMAGMAPGMAAAMEEQQEAWSRLEGTPLRTVASMVTLPADTELDVEAVLATEELGQGMAGLAGALSGGGVDLRGLMGGDEPPEPAQSVMMRTVLEIADVEELSLSDDDFTVPEGFTRVEPEGGA